jgi:hypothetical protein
MSEREQEIRATMLAAILAQGIPLEQAMSEADVAVRYVLGKPVARPRKNREAILDMWSEGLPGHKIAEKLGLTLGGVNSAVFKARMKGDPRANLKMNLTDEQRAARGKRLGAAAKARSGAP